MHTAHWLSGVRVLDLTRLLPGPFCSLILADLGADVLKVEDLQGGDYARHYPPLDDEGTGAFYAALNRNKRSLALDLKRPQGADTLRQLVASCDVLIESFRPGVMDRLGLSLDALRAINPRLITCSITGFGQTGPLAQRAGHDLGYIARAGVLWAHGSQNHAPRVPGVQIADIAGGALWAAIGITSALYQRERTGQGAALDISMTDGAAAMLLPMFATRSAGELDGPGEGMLTGGVPCYGVYECKDGRFLAVSALEPKFWLALLTLLGLPELAADGLTSGLEGACVRGKIGAALRTKTRDEWVEAMRAVDVCCEPVLSPEEVVTSELARARQLFFVLNGVRHTRTPLTSPERAHTPAPLHGQHSREALASYGLSAEAIDALFAQGVVR
jgi:crotonobetainyl-CoA:carnitine CoA-transferase CaiB-like acyl-CoA transferase